MKMIDFETALQQKAAKKVKPLEMKCPDGVRLECGDAFIELMPDGSITIKAKSIQVNADKICKINGSEVQLIGKGDDELGN